MWAEDEFEFEMDEKAGRELEQELAHQALRDERAERIYGRYDMPLPWEQAPDRRRFEHMAEQELYEEGRWPQPPDPDDFTWRSEDWWLG